MKSIHSVAYDYLDEKTNAMAANQAKQRQHQTFFLDGVR